MSGHSQDTKTFVLYFMRVFCAFIHQCLSVYWVSSPKQKQRHAFTAGWESPSFNPSLATSTKVDADKPRGVKLSQGCRVSAHVLIRAHVPWRSPTSEVVGGMEALLIISPQANHSRQNLNLWKWDKKKKSTHWHTCSCCSLRARCSSRYPRRLLRDTGRGLPVTRRPRHPFPEKERSHRRSENTLKERWRRGSEDD